MNTIEFSNGFDVLLDSYAHIPEYGMGAAAGDINLDEYEKSLFLTEAEQQLVKEWYEGYSGSSFEVTESARRKLANLVRNVEMCEKAEKGINPETGRLSTGFSLPSDLWYIIYEWVSFKSDNPCIAEHEGTVVPVKYDSLSKDLRNPFRKPNANRVFRLDLQSDMVELLSEYPIDKYHIKYIMKPEPIILTDLPAGLTIDGLSWKNECKLNSSVHQDILERAVRLAIASRSRG